MILLHYTYNADKTVVRPAMMYDAGTWAVKTAREK